MATLGEKHTSHLEMLGCCISSLFGLISMARSSKTEFENLPNFRQAGGRSLATMNGSTVKNGMIYRSSRTDFVTRKDLALFRQLGIKSIIDLRGKREYQTANGEKLLNPLYSPYIVKNGVTKELKPSFFWEKKKGFDGSGKGFGDTKPLGRRYLVTMTSMKLIWHLSKKLNIFIQWFTLLIALFDWITGTNYFIKLFNYYVLNKETMAERYTDILEYNKEAVRDCIRLVCERHNLPVLIHCAHGKDRTGILVALILSAIGVSDGAVMEDYTMSEKGLLCIKERVYNEVVTMYGFGHEKFLSARPGVIKELFAELRSRYGSISGYLMSTGLSFEELQSLKYCLTEK